VLVGGTIWRYRYDQFGWTTRSSQLYESRLLRIGSPMFHFGLLVVLGGHLMGLLIPKAWTDLVVSQETYHLVALSAGTIAGVATLLGIGLLIYRRRTTGPVFLATTNNDKLMYVVLVAAIVFGMIATLTGGHTPSGAEHNYRETRVGLVPVDDHPPARRRSHGRRHVAVQGAHPRRNGAVRPCALQPTGARIHSASALPVPAIHRLPQPGRSRPHSIPRTRPRMGPRRDPGPRPQDPMTPAGSRQSALTTTTGAHA